MQRRHTHKREAILQAALELIAENGFHGSPAAMIAERAEVGAGTIYRYFENKDVLIRDLYRQVEGRITVALMENYPADRTVRDRFCHIGRGLLAHFIRNPLDFRFIEQFIHSPFGVTVRREKILGESVDQRDFMWHLLTEGIADGSVKNLPIVLLFALSFGPLINASRDHALGFVDLNAGFIDVTVDACWDAIALRPGTGPGSRDGEGEHV